MASTLEFSPLFRSNADFLSRTISTACIGVLITIAQSVAFALLWRWFATPLGAPNINIYWAIGLACLIALAKSIVIGDAQYSRTAIAGSLVRTSLLLAIGYLAHEHQTGRMHLDTWLN